MTIYICTLNVHAPVLLKEHIKLYDKIIINKMITWS